ncbi:MAG TPA: class I SAM-dependent methyltransferase [Longimicrobium sp.]|nr:class I SAM-dependent methyltransferase [Longimicrobium sp.]
MSATGLCRFCQAPLQHSFCDLGMSPLSNAMLTERQLHDAELFYPLHAFVCTECWLVQLGEFESPENIFSEYTYFSSYSESWLRHAREYSEMITRRLGLGPGSLVVEIASNDGYLLKNFVEHGIPALGVEPAANVADVARERGIPTVARFFGAELANELAAERGGADLIAGNNVLAHVPALNDFVEGLRILLKPQGVITLEFPHLLRLMEGNQFDTIYHEHFSYLSLGTVARVMEAHGLRVHDVEELPTHGGSLRVYAVHRASGHDTCPAVGELLERERAYGLEGLDAYTGFARKTEAAKRALLRFLIDAREEGKRVVGYGAAAKGNTLLNYCGVRTDLVDYVVDRSPHKQGRYLPGTHVPVLAPEAIAETRPDYVLILPWNLTAEIVEQMAGIREWGGRFVVPIPTTRVIS